MIDKGRKKGLHSVTTLSKDQYQKLYNSEFIYYAIKYYIYTYIIHT